MTAITIDASIVLKWFSSEEDNDVAAQVYNYIKQGTLTCYAPTLLLLEVANVLVKNKKVAHTWVKKVITSLVNSGIVFVDVNPADYPDLVRLMNLAELTAYDALYLHLARSKNTHLLTADKQLLHVFTTSIDLASFEPELH